MWPYNKKEIETERIRYIDWSKVKTVEDIVNVLRESSPSMRQIKVSEEYWSNSEINHLLTDEVYIRNLDGYSFTLEKTDNNL